MSGVIKQSPQPVDVRRLRLTFRSIRSISSVFDPSVTRNGFRPNSISKFRAGFFFEAIMAVPAVQPVLVKLLSVSVDDPRSNNSYAVAQSMTMFQPPAPPTEMKTFKSGRRGRGRQTHKLGQSTGERRMWFGFGGFLFDCVDQSPL
jgi:hypothetical protein